MFTVVATRLQQNGDLVWQSHVSVSNGVLVCQGHVSVSNGDLVWQGHVSVSHGDLVWQGHVNIRRTDTRNDDATGTHNDDTQLKFQIHVMLHVHANCGAIDTKNSA